MFLSRNSDHASALLAVMASVVGLAIPLLPWPWLPRFTWDFLNLLYVAVLAVALPYSLVAIASGLQKRRHRIACRTVAGLTVVLLIFAAAVSMIAEPPTERISEVPTSEGAYRLYRIECELLCPTRLELRKELEFLSVLKLVRTVWAGERDTAELHQSPDGNIEVHDGDRLISRVRD